MKKSASEESEPNIYVFLHPITMSILDQKSKNHDNASFSAIITFVKNGLRQLSGGPVHVLGLPVPGRGRIKTMIVSRSS